MGFKYIPRLVHRKLLREQPAYRWLCRSAGFRNTPWKEFPDQMVKSWGKEKLWSINVDEKGATIYGPDGDAVFWPA